MKRGSLLIFLLVVPIAFLALRKPSVSEPASPVAQYDWNRLITNDLSELPAMVYTA